MEVQCYEMWDKVSIEKLQNDPSLVNHSFFSVLLSEFPNVSRIFAVSPAIQQAPWYNGLAVPLWSSDVRSWVGP